MRLTPLCGLALGAWLVAACGGRTETITEASGGSPGAGGAPASAGASSGRAGAGQAGSSVGVAGAPGAGAGGKPALCDNADCPDIFCTDGSEPVVPAGECCAICQPRCKQVCPSCPTDTVPMMHLGDCCPTCVPDPRIITNSCQFGKMHYETLRGQMIKKYSQGCTVDSDCVVVEPSNACEAGCDANAVLSIVAADFMANTSSIAKMDCANCPPVVIPLCAPPLPPRCLSNICALPVEIDTR